MVSAMAMLSMLLMDLLLFSGAWILTENMNVDVGEKRLDIFCSLCVLLTIAWMSKVYRFKKSRQIPAKWKNGTHVCFMELKPFGGPKGLSREEMIQN